MFVIKYKLATCHTSNSKEKCWISLNFPPQFHPIIFLQRLSRYSGCNNESQFIGEKLAMESFATVYSRAYFSKRRRCPSLNCFRFSPWSCSDQFDGTMLKETSNRRARISGSVQFRYSSVDVRSMTFRYVSVHVCSMTPSSTMPTILSRGATSVGFVDDDPKPNPRSESSGSFHVGPRSRLISCTTGSYYQDIPIPSSGIRIGLSLRDNRLFLQLPLESRETDKNLELRPYNQSRRGSRGL